MHDLSSPSAGAQIVVASSNDARFPVEAIIDGKTDTFWATTGLYPQNFILALPSAAQISSVMIQCYNVKTLGIEKTIKQDPIEFEEVGEIELDFPEGTLQKKSISPESCEARFLKFVIKSGYDHFCSVHRIAVSGSII